MMRHAVAVAAFAVLVAGSAELVARQAPAAPQKPSFTSAIDVVSLNVTVADQSGRYVTDLAQTNFQVFEDGVKQDVSFFNKANSPIALSILMDTSASMEARIGTAQDAAIGFVRKLRQQDVAELIDFDSRAVTLQSFTNNIPALEQAIRKTAAGGSTSLYNAVYIALRDLKKTVPANPDDIRRQAIVVLSDGEDTSSLLSFDEVLDLAKRSDTAIYSIGLRSEEESNASKGFREAEFVLRQFSQETGGRAFFPSQVSELSGVYGQIADELSSQYVLGYSSKNTKRDGAWRRIAVRVDRPGVSTRTKTGYFGPGH
jgi:Ca-activated chloride channel family protein